ncbi:MAG: glutamate--tRNA ligase [Candidatus Moranbacteria bacterium CG_4_8_14_3_um_filter_34_16]|nr:MAG: glutamate--tRNA ligase [Candidatus Moranbacteria bacterium CG08_land_8_20_14_0_20_34_16]PIW94964.1 MAG: glutamate--tRNA ligase [Candidatus Moranbacteria bacterium CG_4_8_14_3_um_filter_34_16]
MSKIRVRFAPSPTGYLHIGSLRTALYDYLFAQKNDGDFILKIEDTDRKRFVDGAVESLIKSLDLLGLKRNEGVFQKTINKNNDRPVLNSKNYPGILEVGDYGPYIQSEKIEIYKKYAEELIKKGYAYYCFCTQERLEEMRRDQSVMKKPPIYDRYCLKNISEKEINQKLKEKCSYVVRLKMPQDETLEFEDMVRGKVKFETNLVDDTVLLKSDGFPTYHLANVIDDYEMKVTHVIRGEEWLSSVPKHLILYRYFGWTPPQFAHLPLLLNADKSKLSKRQGDVAVEDYLKKGYLKEALLNFVAFLGWNPGKGETQEIFTLEELVEKFDFSHVHKSGAVFDIKKLDWTNSQWIKKMSLDELWSRTGIFLKIKEFYKNWSEKNKNWSNKEKEEYEKKVLTLERERLVKLSEVGESNKFFFEDIVYDKNLLKWKDMNDEKLKNNLKKARKILSAISKKEWKRKNLEKNLLEASEENRGEFLWPLRVALTGEQKSPPPFECAWVLGKEETLKRIEKALNLFL